jgi:hypothetical protein
MCKERSDMSQSEMILFAVKLILGGITALTAVMLYSKTKDGAWISMVAGFIFAYAESVYTLLVDLGLRIPFDFYIAGIPFTSLLFTVLPWTFFILAFSIMLTRK